MAQQIPDSPALPYPSSGTDHISLSAFDQDLTKALFINLSTMSRRLNDSLQKDGSEAMTGDLNMGGFDIVNIGSVGVEATWTPVVAFGGASTGVTYTHQTGRYTKVGRLVFIQCDVLLSNNGSSTGALTITGLPFAVSTVRGSAAVGLFSGFTGLTGSLYVNFNGSSAEVVQSGAAATAAVTEAATTDTMRLIFNGFYTV